MNESNSLHSEIVCTLEELSASVRDLEALSDKLSIDDIYEVRRSLQILDDIFFSVSRNIGLVPHLGYGY